MEKPISLKMKDFKTDLVDLINHSGLPLFIIEPILKDILAVIQTRVEEDYQRDKALYEQSLTEENDCN